MNIKGWLSLPTRVRRVDLGREPKLLDRMKFNYNWIIKKIIGKIAWEMYQAR